MLNHIDIAGRLVRDPELREANGVPVCSFRIACDRDYKTQSGERETDFFDVVAWRKLAETVGQYFTKGRMAVVSGRLQARTWTDRDQNKRYSTEIVADSVYFGDSKPREQNGQGGSGPATASSGGQNGGYGQRNNGGSQRNGYSGGNSGYPGYASPPEGFVPDFDGGEEDGELPF